ncbi:ligand-binding sensor domain-containing protein [Spirosoma fluviale]|uniref:Two component regulator propeller n=1 Tax=Spirosoma fluviale TaxID=1597977 RepID=A0A286GB09_9BACT|nr:two-component regulator propeller domain-containing protein [Spirosoma fluviale]SOD92194.1 Two component regulator propeller [Spirosoma fluviale]
MKYAQIFTFLTILLFGTACNGPVKKDLPKEKAHPKLIKNIGNGNVQCGLQDKAGNLWFGTSANGLYKYDEKSFTQFLVADGLSSNNISCVLEDRDGKIWIGTDAELCLYDPSTLLRTGGKTFAQIQIPLPKNLPPNKGEYYRNSHWVFSIMQAKSGKLWFATIDGVYIYDGTSFTPFIINEASGGYLSSNNNVEHILEDKAGNIWFGGRGNAGVYRYDGKSVINFSLKELTLQFETRRVGHNWASPQLQDKNGNIWFSNWGGAYRYDGKTFTSFTKSDGMPGYNGLVAKIIEDKNGILWFGGDGGLSRYDGKSFTGFKDGLINPWIWTILEDKTGDLWVGTRETGLYLFNGKTFINYSEYKGKESQK